MVVRIIGKKVVGVVLPLCLFCYQASAGEFHKTDISNTSKTNINPANALRYCSSEKDDQKRLICFDLAAKRFSRPTYAGRLGMVTENFTIQKPHFLRFRSQGVIFVLYLRDKNGEVLQNFHIGGSGEDQHLINKSGTYSLKIHGSASWEIWLYPKYKE